MSGLEKLLQSIASITPTFSAQIVLAFAAVILSIVYLAFAGRATRLRLSDARQGRKELDGITGIVAGIILGALTGILWAVFNPIMIVPPFIHLRVFSFFIPVIGLLLGRSTGFISGYVATLVWAVLAGAFVPLHTPIADGIFVGLTGFIPAHVLRGNLTNDQLLEKIQSAPWKWYLQTAAVCLCAGLFMGFFAAWSLQIFTPLPFWLSFLAIGVVSDTLPMILFTGIATQVLLLATRRSWAWMPSF